MKCHCWIWMGFYLLIGTVQADTLIEIYRQAEQNDPQLKIANSDRLITVESKAQVDALFKPQVNAGANVTEQNVNKYWLTGDSVENTTAGYNVSLSYGLYHRERDILSEQTDKRVEQAKVVYELARQTLMLRLASSYFDVLAGNDNLEFARLTKSAFQRQLEQAKQRYEVGLIAITDVQESQAGYDLAVAEEIQAINELGNAHESLREITGGYYETLGGLDSESPLLYPNPQDINQWTEVALKNNLQVISTQYSVAISQQEIDRRKAGHLPTVDLVGNHHFNDRIRGSNTNLSARTNNTIGVQVSMPIYEGGMIDSQVREAQQRHVQSLDQLDQQRRTVESQIHNAYLNVISNISRVKALKQALISSKTALEAVQTGFEVGTRTSVDVLSAQRSLLGAQRNYARARYDYLLHTLRLKQAAGLLNLEDLKKISAWLNKPVNTSVAKRDTHQPSSTKTTPNASPSLPLKQSPSAVTPPKQPLSQPANRAATPPINSKLPVDKSPPAVPVQPKINEPVTPNPLPKLPHTEKLK